MKLSKKSLIWWKWGGLLIIIVLLYIIISNNLIREDFYKSTNKKCGGETPVFKNGKCISATAGAQVPAPPRTGGTCFKGDTLILLENNIYKEISKIIKNDRLRLSNNTIGIVNTLLKYEYNTDINICNIDGFYVTPYHPIYKMINFSKDDDNNNWVNPIALSNPNKEKIDYIFDIQIRMEDGSLPNAGYVIKGKNNNWAGIPAGNVVNHPLIKNPFWTTHIVNILDILKSEKDENGTMLFKKNEFSLCKNKDFITYGLIYKNKLYTFKDDKIIILDYEDTTKYDKILNLEKNNNILIEV